MAKLSEQKKVELLETAVLTGTPEEVTRVMNEHSPFEFTARALGYAARFRGAEMVKCLLAHGATFAYEAVPAFAKKYATKVAISNIYSYNVDYSLYLLKDHKIDPVPDSAQLLDDEERTKVMELLHTEAEKAAVNEADILYFSILYGDTAIRDACAKLGVCNLSDIRAANIRCDTNYAHMDGLDRHFRDGFTWTLRKANPDNFKRILMDILPMLGEKQMQMMPADIFFSFQDKKQFFTAYCAEGLFELVLKHTNLTDKVKKWDMLYALVDHNNASGVQYALEQEWISKPKDLETLLKYAQSKENRNAALVGCIMDKLEKNAPVRKKEESLALAANPLSAAELKKIWTTKKLEDGSLIITGYKGDALDVIVPDAFGKVPVTALGSDVFSVKAPRLTREQIEVRENIQSVEIPGSIAVIPKNLFGNENALLRWGAGKLKRVVLGKGVREISEGAFSRCVALDEIVLPQTLTTIGKQAFSHCRSLPALNLPESVSAIGWGAYSDCEALKELVIPKGVSKLPDNIFSSDGWFNGCGFETVTIPDHITAIGNCAFAGCKMLKKVVLSANMTEIPRMVFERCEALESVWIPGGVSAIAVDAFRGCAKLTIHAPAGSYAETYAKENNIPFVAE